MINLGQVLSGKPLLITGELYFYQPTIQEIIDMGENTYWSSLNLWLLKRKDLISEENEYTMGMDDFTLWKEMMCSSPSFLQALALSCRIFFHTKIEFFEISRTIYIGEKGSGTILDNSFYLLVKELCSKMISYTTPKEAEKQYQETEHMSEREKYLIEKMKAGEKKLEQAKNKDADPQDQLGRKLLGLVAIGHYTFEQAYNLTMLQFNLLLQKYIDIQGFELRTVLSPYMSSDDGDQNNEFWLN